MLTNAVWGFLLILITLVIISYIYIVDLSTFHGGWLLHWAFEYPVAASTRRKEFLSFAKFHSSSHCLYGEILLTVHCIVSDIVYIFGIWWHTSLSSGCYKSWGQQVPQYFVRSGKEVHMSLESIFAQGRFHVLLNPTQVAPSCHQFNTYPGSGQSSSSN